jgi:putative membrane protein
VTQTRMKSPLLILIIRWLVLAIGVMLATKIIPGIAYDTGTTLLVVVLLLSFFNVILKPLLVLFTLPFIILTMGLGMIVINALLFLFVGKLVDGFQVSGFWAALGGALIVSVTNLIFTRMLAPPRTGRPPVKKKPDDVIDV